MNWTLATAFGFVALLIAGLTVAYFLISGVLIALDAWERRAEERQP